MPGDKRAKIKVTQPKKRSFGLKIELINEEAAFDGSRVQRRSAVKEFKSQQSRAKQRANDALTRSKSKQTKKGRKKKR